MIQKYFYALLLAFAFFSGFGQTLDQSNTSYDSGQLILNPNYPHLAQSFTNGLTGMLSSISVDIQDNPVYPTIDGDFDLTIYSGEGISGAVLLTHTFSIADNFTGELVINFNPVSVTSGTVNTFKISPSASSAGRLLVSMKSGNNYSGGILYNGNFGASTDYDLWFKTFVTVPAPATHLNFDGTNDYVNLGTSLAASLNGSTSLTFEAWINPSVLNGWNNIITDYNGAYHKVLLRIRNSNNIQFVVNSTFLNSSYAIPLNTWTHVAAVYDGANMYVYANGSLVASQPAVISLPTSTDQFNIGSRVGGSEYFTGNIDDVRVWNIARTAEQIAGAMNCELQGNESGLVAYYQFNQGTDQVDNSGVTTLTDATANANNGTLANFALTGSTSNWLAGSPVTTGSTVPVAPTVSTPVMYTQGDTASTLTATTGGTGVLWYTSATGGSGTTVAPTPDTTTLGTTSYWVSSTNANGCESERIEIVVQVNELTNNVCDNAFSLTVGSTSFNDFPADVNLTGATDSGVTSPYCGNYQGGDKWFTVVIPTSGNVIIETDGAGLYDTGLAIYTGDCNTLALYDCDDNSGNDNYSKFTILGETPGTILYVRVWENFWGTSNAQFQISAYEPYYNICSSTTALTVGTTFSDYPVDVDLTGATDSGVTNPGCASYYGGDQWFTVVVPNSGNLTIDTEGTNDDDTGLAVYNGNCDNGLTQIGCNDDNGNNAYSILTLSGLTSGETLYVRVWEYGEGTSTIQFQVSAYEIVPPVNDLCSGALSLTVGGVFTDYPVNVDLTGSTDSGVADPGCASYYGGDQWFTAVVPASGSITVETDGVNDDDTGIAVYSGSCSLLTQIDCNDDNDTNTYSVLSLTGLTSGETIYIRVWEYDESDSTIQFQVSAYDASLSNESFERNDFTIYPNPANNFFKVNAQETVSIEVYDILGKLVVKKENNSSNDQINISNLNAGVYMVNVKNDNGGIKIFKLIKE